MQRSVIAGLGDEQGRRIGDGDVGARQCEVDGGSGSPVGGVVEYHQRGGNAVGGAHLGDSEPGDSAVRQCWEHTGRLAFTPDRKRLRLCDFGVESRPGDGHTSEQTVDDSSEVDSIIELTQRPSREDGGPHRSGIQGGSTLLDGGHQAIQTRPQTTPPQRHTQAAQPDVRGERPPAALVESTRLPAIPGAAYLVETGSGREVVAQGGTHLVRRDVGCGAGRTGAAQRLVHDRSPSHSVMVPTAFFRYGSCARPE